MIIIDGKGRSENILLPTIGQVGSKAGSLHMIESFTPAYFVLSTECVEELWSDRRKKRSIILNEISVHCEKNGFKDVIVRSSVVGEQLTSRGKFKSAVCKSQIKLFSVITDVIRSYKSINNELKGGVIIQKYIKSEIIGHFSNERRISRSKDIWDVEVERTRQVVRRKVRVETSRNFKPLQGELNFDVTIGKLREIAKKFVREDKRYHFEWVWNRVQGLQLVQIDEEVFHNQLKPGSRWDLEDKEALVLSNPKVLVHIDNCDIPSEKVNSSLLLQKIFETKVDYYILSKVEACYKSSTLYGVLCDDLLKLLSYPIIIRCDVVNGESNFSLPRSAPISELDDALDYMHASVSDLEGIGNSNIIFIIHRYIPAGGCALVYAKPDSDEVLVNAAHGMPDTLHAAPFDTFVFSIEDQSLISKTIRWKDHYIDFVPPASWETVEAGWNYDYAEAASKTEVKSMANKASQVASKIGKPIILMFFTRVDERSGHPSILPWHHTVQIPNEALSSLRPVEHSKTVYIDDVHSIEMYISNPPKESALIQFVPNSDLIRKHNKISRLGHLAAIHGHTISMLGSPLSHSFYILSRQRAQIICQDVPEEFQRVSYNKLVRDRIPDILKSKKIQYVTEEIVNQADFLNILKTKLLEECFEAAFENDIGSLLGELADVLEVVESIAEELSISFDELRNRQSEKRIRTGGFSKRLLLRQTGSNKPPVVALAGDERSLKTVARFPHYANFGSEYDTRIADDFNAGDEIVIRWDNSGISINKIVSIDIDGSQLDLFLSPKRSIR